MSPPRSQSPPKSRPGPTALNVQAVASAVPPLSLVTVLTNVKIGGMNTTADESERSWLPPASQKFGISSAERCNSGAEAVQSHVIRRPTDSACGIIGSPVLFAGDVAAPGKKHITVSSGRYSKHYSNSCFQITAPTSLIHVLHAGDRAAPHMLKYAWPAVAIASNDVPGQLVAPAITSPPGTPMVHGGVPGGFPARLFGKVWLGNQEGASR